MSENVLSGKQVTAIARLVAGDDVARAARAAGVTERTLVRWRSEPDFAEALRDARRQHFEATLVQLEAASHEAVGVCRELMTVREPHASHSSRLSAAKAVLAVALKAHEAVNIEERLRALEGRLS